MAPGFTVRVRHRYHPAQAVSLAVGERRFLRADHVPVDRIAHGAASSRQHERSRGASPARGTELDTSGPVAGYGLGRRPPADIVRDPAASVVRRRHADRRVGGRVRGDPCCPTPRHRLSSLNAPRSTTVARQHPASLRRLGPPARDDRLLAVAGQQEGARGRPEFRRPARRHRDRQRRDRAAVAPHRRPEGRGELPAAGRAWLLRWLDVPPRREGIHDPGWRPVR